MRKRTGWIGIVMLMMAVAIASGQTNTFPSSGNVGIGTTAPQDILDVNGNVVFGDGGAARLSLGSDSLGFNRQVATGDIYDTQEFAYQFQHWGSTTPGSDVLELQIYSPSGGQVANSVLAVTANKYVGIGTNSPSAKLEVDGNIKLTAGSGASITFPDGTVQSTAYTGVACGGDYAESVKVQGKRPRYEPGDVLVISKNSGSDVALSQTPYSTSVVGVFSTKPGYVGRRFTGPKSKREVPMAMIGIVPVKVTAANGPIHRGDLLVTSSMPGYAMKGTDRGRMLGAVLGKALGNLNSGKGVIEAVITLQ